jgi:molybdate transport system substrate-binding protein
MSSRLTLISSMATREVLSALAARYEHETHQTIATSAAGGVDVAKRVRNGEAVDIVVLASNAIDGLIADGKVLTGSRVDLLRSGVAIAVRAGAPRPEISSEESVKQAVLAARTLGYSTGPSGVYLERLFARWGVLDAIRPRIVVPPPGTPVGSLVADGTVALGFQQLSELVNLAGVDVLGPLPPAVQTVTVFSGGVSATCARPDEARAALTFMASSAVADIAARHGMERA